MNEENEIRQASARRMASLWAEAGAVAVLHAGSSAYGEADAFSDVDMSVYYDGQLPSPEAMRGVRSAVGGGERLYWVDDLANGACVESFVIDGIRHDFAHVTVERWSRDMEVVLVRHQADSPLQKAVSGLMKGIPLHGAERIAAWRARATPYPEGLRLAMVRHYLRFHPPWVPLRMGLERGDEFWAREIAIDACKGVLGVLMGLNRVYHWGEYKRQEKLLGALEIAPPELSARVNRICGGPVAEAIAELDALVLETFALAEQHLPEAEAPRIRARYTRPENSW